MRNLKVSLTILPIFAVAFIIYFSVQGFSSEPKHAAHVNSIQNKTSGTVFTVHLLGSTGCLNGNYTYCVNGGLITNASGDFQVELECNQYSTICVQSSSGCKGTWSGYANCEDGLLINITLVPNEEGLCDCMR